MKSEDVANLRPGDRVYWWFDTGAMGASQVPASVVRVNRLTVTVNARGDKLRIPHGNLAGKVDWEE